MMRPHAALPALLALAAGAAQACPTAEDVSAGLLLTMDNGDTEIIQRQDALRVTSLFQIEGETVSSMVLVRGLYPVSIAEIDGGLPIASSLVAFAYPMAPEDMPLPVDLAGSTWTVPVTITDSGGPQDEMHHYAFGEIGKLTIGACPYQVIRTEVRYEPTEDVEILEFLPELGISLLTETSYDGAIERYTYIAIEAEG